MGDRAHGGCSSYRGGRADPHGAWHFHLAGVRGRRDSAVQQNVTGRILPMSRELLVRLAKEGRALNGLRKAGLLSGALDRLTLAKLRVRLDWRTFVDVDTYTLIDHPHNYYCVAFGIARLRVLMGWEDVSGSEQLLKKMLEH